MTTVILLFILGVSVGSFLNVLGLRWRSGMGANGRSICLSCQKKLQWYELIPIVSFVIQNGKCRRCKTKLTWQYPLIELLTGIVFVTIFNSNLSFIENVFLITVFSIFIVISIYDWRHKIIPDELVFASLLASIVFRFLVGGSWMDWSAAAFIFIFFFLIWLISRGKAMGFGDAKLGAAIGFLLGASYGFSAIVLAFWIGAILSILYMILEKTSLLKKSKGLTMKSEIAFAPYLIFGAWASLTLGLNLLHVAF